MDYQGALSQRAYEAFADELAARLAAGSGSDAESAIGERASCGI